MPVSGRYPAPVPGTLHDATPVEPGPGGTPGDDDVRRRRAVVALAVWGALILVSVAWGAYVTEVGERLRIHAPPLTGTYDWRIGRNVAPAVVLGVAVVAFGPSLARRLSWARVLVLVGLGSIAWAVSLGIFDGIDALTDPLLPKQYIRSVPKVGDPFTFLSQFTDRITTYNIHTQGHPPGMVLVLWVLDRVGLGGLGWNAVLVFAGGGAGAVAALVALREVAGEASARTAAPFMVVMPAAIWWTSGDAFFSAVAGWGVTLVVLATGRTGRRADVLAFGGGLLFGVAAFLSYGLVLLAAIPLVVAVARRRFRPIVVACVGALPVFLAFLAAGFWWFAGLAATRERYFAGVASRRSYAYFLVGNLGAFAIATGPAVAVALAWLRDRGVWLLVGGALVVVALADLSGMSKAEVERIWVPFVPWVVLATAAFISDPDRRRRMRHPTVRAWLGLQVASGLLVQLAVRSPW